MISSDANKTFRDQMWVPIWKYNELLLLEGSKVVKILSHPSFSHVHTIDLIQDAENPATHNLLVSSRYNLKSRKLTDVVELIWLLKFRQMERSEGMSKNDFADHQAMVGF